MRDKFIVFVFITFLFSFSLFFLFKEDKDISKYERRKLVTSSSLKKDVFGNLDDYYSDQFPFRDEFISLNSVINRYLLRDIESNNVYVLDDYVIEKNYPMNMKSVDNFVNKINYINEEFLSNSKVYLSIIPDKSYFLDDDKYLKLDFDSLINSVRNRVDVSYIDIKDLLDLDDYYRTDIHIKQDSYFKVIEELDKYLNFNYKEIDYKRVNYSNFYGASSSKVPSFFKPDDLVYLTNKITDDVQVKHLEFGLKDVYDKEKLYGVDSYDVFLSGPSSFIEIINGESENSRELIVFRDSFGSSLVPILIPFYSKITVVDLRYISLEIVKDYIDFDGNDVLFLYSTLIINNSSTLKV